MLNAADFAKLGFWEDNTPEENITIYGMDFAETYVTLTDVDGKTPTEENKGVIMAAYDETGCFLWFREFKSFKELADVCQAAEPESDALWDMLVEGCAK